EPVFVPFVPFVLVLTTFDVSVAFPFSVSVLVVVVLTTVSVVDIAPRFVVSTAGMVVVSAVVFSFPLLHALIAHRVTSAATVGLLILIWPCPCEEFARLSGLCGQTLYRRAPQSSFIRR